MDASSELMTRLLAAKTERRRELSTATFAEKIEMLIRLQEMTAPILKQKGVDVKPWSHLRNQIQLS